MCWAFYICKPGRALGLLEKDSALARSIFFISPLLAVSQKSSPGFDPLQAMERQNFFPLCFSTDGAGLASLCGVWQRD